MATVGDRTPLQEFSWGAENLSWGRRSLSFGAPESAIVLDNLNRMPTPLVYEWAFGDDLICDEDSSYSLVFVPIPRTPEQIIVRAAFNIGIPAYAVYQPGGRPVLPSIVFESTGIEETAQLDRGHLDRQDFTITVRDKLYDDVVSNTDRYFYSLKSVAGSRYSGISGQWSDEFRPSLGYRERTFSVTLRR